ncbi:MAG: hypothetical protein EBU46_12220 [Nitrosomonadaceae bacterium]|nr:hypothetical protein [Nitrosomonadaceae bacterium]
MAIPLPQQQQQPVKRQRPSISPWLMGAAALGGGYLADRYGNGGKGMDWLKSKFQPQTATATASPATCRCIWLQLRIHIKPAPTTSTPSPTHCRYYKFSCWNRLNGYHGSNGI